MEGQERHPWRRGSWGGGESRQEVVRAKLLHFRVPVDEYVDFYTGSVFECAWPFCECRDDERHPDLERK